MKNEENLTNKVQLSTPFEFTPYIAYQFPNLQTFTVDYENKLYPDQMQVTHGKKKRLVIIKDPQVRVPSYHRSNLNWRSEDKQCIFAST
jgi:hypothetical protein